jgi:peptide/nickel transport system permease protein
MSGFLYYLAARFLTFLGILFIGITIVFIIPRLMPSDPIDSYLQRIDAEGGSALTADEVAAIRETLGEMYGIQGSLWSQYLGYLHRVFIKFDFGPSLTAYPVPVSDFIRQALPWTLGLLVTSTVIAWMLGNLIGLIAGFFHDRRYAAVAETIGILIYPIPYYVFALILIILFTYLIPIFPLTTTIIPGPLSIDKVVEILYNSILPALTLVLAGFGWNVLGMKALAYATKEESFVVYAQLKGVTPRRTMFSYIFRNAMLPQVTGLTLQLGRIFSGALITEMLFAYPGIGMLMRRAIGDGDYNMLYGTITVSLIAVATGTLIIDLIYPILDPRIRHR